MTVQSLIHEIDKAIAKDLLIIVEGIKDKSALEALGFLPENIFIINVKGSINEFIEKIAEKRKETIILTDFDSTGKKLYHQIKKELVKQGVRVNDSLRLAVMKQRISHIEGLATFLNRNSYL
jgi:5S rRNA maturation endonuclease (ribonuclease M5)